MSEAILVVDDDASIRRMLERTLVAEGYQVDGVADGGAALASIERSVPDLVILDLGLPGMDGVDVCRRVRARGLATPILLLTARDTVPARVEALDAGGDDYVVKPFSLEEVVARLRGLVRRAGLAAEAAGDVLTVGDLVMEEDSREVSRGGEPISLTATEFELLRFLMRNPRRVLSKPQILDRVWNYDFGGQANVVELYISYLRKKIDAGRAPMIHTMRGAGYVL